MPLLTDERAQAIQIGAVLLFGILVIFLSLYQAFVVPDQNEEIEFNHNEELQEQMTELRSNVVLMPGSTTTRAASVDLGVRYPSRAVFVNPGPASGTLRTVGTGNPGINVTIDNATAVETEGETGDFWNGTALSYPTGALAYQPGYNLYGNAPRTIYEHSVLYNSFDRGIQLPITGQTLVDDNRITLVALDGSLSESRVDTASVDFDPVSTRSRVVEVNNTGGPITLEFASRMNASGWNDTLEDQRTTNGGHVQNVRFVRDGPGDFSILEIALETDQRYELELAKVGVGTGATDTGATYLTDITGDGTTVQEGETQTLTVEARDAFNSPQSGVRVTASPEGGSFTDDGTETTDNQGQAAFRYEAQAPGTHRINFTIDPGYTPDGSHNSTTPRNVTVTVSVESVSEAGDGRSAFNTTWQEPDETRTGVSRVDGGWRFNQSAAAGPDLELAMQTDPSAADARVEFALNDTAAATVDPTENRTATDGTAATTLTPLDNGTVSAYTWSGGSGDRIEVELVGVAGRAVDNLDLSVDPNRSASSAVHNWTFDNVDFGDNENDDVDTITVDYAGTGASFDGLDETDITVVLTRELSGGPDTSEISVNSDTYAGESATFDLSGGFETSIVGEGYVRIDGLENPPAGGSYTGEITFDGTADTVAVDRGFEIVEPAFFDVNITDTNSPVDEGETLTVDVNVTNTGDETATQTLNLTDRGFNNAEQDTVDVTLDGGEWNNSITLEWDTNNGDGGSGNVTVLSENSSGTRNVTVNAAGQILEPVESRSIMASNKLEFSITNTGSSDVEIRNFSIELTNYSTKLKNNNMPEFSTNRADPEGEAYRQNIKTDGTVYDIVDDSTGNDPAAYPTIPADEDDVDVYFRTFKAGDILNGAEFVESRSQADITVTFGLADGSVQEIYLSET